jgi:hypothetical protein
LWHRGTTSAWGPRTHRLASLTEMAERNRLLGYRHYLDCYANSAQFYVAPLPLIGLHSGAVCRKAVHVNYYGCGQGKDNS